MAVFCYICYGVIEYKVTFQCMAMGQNLNSNFALWYAQAGFMISQMQCDFCIFVLPGKKSSFDTLILLKLPGSLCYCI